MSTDFRALCAELTDRLQHAITSVNADSYYGENRDAVDRARAALAHPEPVAPTDEELDRFADEVWSGSPRRYARAALARWGTPANNISEEN